MPLVTGEHLAFSGTQNANYHLIVPSRKESGVRFWMIIRIAHFTLKGRLPAGYTGYRQEFRGRDASVAKRRLTEMNPIPSTI